MKRLPRYTKLFRRQYKKYDRTKHHAIDKIDAVLQTLIRKQTLPSHWRDHALHGEWKGCRDCHIEGDWILIYELGVNADDQETITFHAMDNHENLFD